MQSLALRGGPLEIMASLLPCAWSYVEIAADLRERTDLEHPVYGGWIAYFSLPSNVEMVASMRRDFDALVAEEVRPTPGAKTRPDLRHELPARARPSGTWPTRWSSGPTWTDRGRAPLP